MAAVECVVVFLLVLGLFLAALVVFAGSANSRAARWNQAFAQVAQQFRGSYASGGWFSEPSVRLMYGTAHARLSCYSLGRSGKTVVQLVIEQQEARSRAEMLSRPSTVTLVPSLAGLTEVELNWGQQFARWEVAAADYDEARHLLTDAVRLALDRVWLHPLPSDTAVSLLPGWIVVRKVWDVPRAADLAQFVELACALNDQVQLAGAAGIEFLTSDEAQVIDDALCCVCCERLTEGVVFCVRCKTPHHRDCWEYSGGCSTYGCGARMFYTPGEAPLVSPPHWQGSSSHAKPGKPR
jgi:hypothetical protein